MAQQGTARLESRSHLVRLTIHAVKRVLAWQIAKEMAARKLTKSDMARRMKTSRTQVARLLDPANDKVQLDTMQRAATVVGRTLHMELT
jgi:antitoxin HicB